MKTRDKIILTSLTLYNVKGVAAVSNNHVSDEMEISPGNLHYHFKTKQQVIETIIEEFNKEFSELFAVDAHTINCIEDFCFILHIAFELMERYSFIFRDIDYIIAKYPEFKRRFQRIFSLFRDANLRLCESLAASGVMDISPLQLRGLATNVLLIYTQWLGFRAFNAKGDCSDGAYLAQGVYQTLLLLEPYLNLESKAYVVNLGEAYS